MINCREEVEQYLWWEPKSGNSSIWFENWSNLGPLYLHQSETHSCHPLKDISEFITEEGWNYGKMKDMVPEYVISHVRDNLEPVTYDNIMDKPWWTKSSKGHFTTSSA